MFQAYTMRFDVWLTLLGLQTLLFALAPARVLGENGAKRIDVMTQNQVCPETLLFDLLLTRTISHVYFHKNFLSSTNCLP